MTGLVSKLTFVVLLLAASLPGWGQGNGYGSSYGSGSSFGNDGGFGDSSDSFRSSRSRSAFGSRSSRSQGQSTNGSSNGTNNTNSSDRTRDRQSYRNRSQSGGRNGRTPTPAPGATGATGKQPVSVKGKTPGPNKGSGGSGSGGAARGATTVEFKMKANPTTNLVFIETVGLAPTMNISTVQGQKFVTRVAFRNPRHSRYDAVDVSIKYDPELLRPLGVDDSTVVNLLSEPGVARVNARKGIIQYHGEFAEPRGDEELTFFKLEWKAKAPTEHTAITLLNSAEYPSRVLHGEDNVLKPSEEEDQEVEYSENAGLLSAAVAIAPDAATAKRIDDSDEVTGIQLAHSISQGTAEGGITLALRSQKATVAKGEDFIVDVIYRNPKRSEIDLVKLKVRFDPQVLQVVDDDENNWITRGVNIFDGDYHEDLPFDFHISNVAYNNTGEISYEMGFSDRVRIPSSGVIASIRFRGIASAPSTEIAFDLDENDKLSNTALSFLGFNLIGTPGNRVAAITNASLNID